MKDSDLDELVDLFSEEGTANEELRRLAMNLAEVDISGLAKECLKVAAQLKQRWRSRL
ncbi:MAG: hypothetical protein HY669_01320 [Chloroflexi bacterium]|nr:hypothetical protein [Chloroflexota bacterium]